MKKDNATNIGKIKIVAIECYVQHYTPSFLQQAIVSKQILSEVPTEFQYVGDLFSIFMEFCISDIRRHKRSYMGFCRFPAKRHTKFTKFKQ